MTHSSKSVSDGVCEECGKPKVFIGHTYSSEDETCVCQPQQKPMNQDNQVGLEKKIEEITSEHNGCENYHDFSYCSPEDVKELLSQVSKDRYAEGIRRAREVVEKAFNDAEGCNRLCEVGRDCQQDTRKACLKALEEEVKK